MTPANQTADTTTRTTKPNCTKCQDKAKRADGTCPDDHRAKCERLHTLLTQKKGGAR